MIEAKITAQAKLTPYAKVDTSLEGVPGDTKTVPSWNYIGDAQDFDPENRTGAERLTQQILQHQARHSQSNVRVNRLEFYRQLLIQVLAIQSDRLNHSLQSLLSVKLTMMCLKQHTQHQLQ